MITEKEYILLIGLKTSPLIDETQYYYEIKTFRQKKPTSSSWRSIANSKKART